MRTEKEIVLNFRTFTVDDYLVSLTKISRLMLHIQKISKTCLCAPDLQNKYRMDFNKVCMDTTLKCDVEVITV